MNDTKQAPFAVPRVVTMSAAGFAMPAVSRTHEASKIEAPALLRKETARTGR
ncbi:MAG: hypothetical protein NXI16_02510 [Alphaproteobacteria bacterium]|nr:hypothetical protein [Alphaproteobacteria bacterium]